MASNGFLTQNEIKENIVAVQAFLKEKSFDAIYISSADPFLNEYVPLENCHRYYVTGFTGSTADVFIPAEGKVRLIVDGRYHEQVDQEIDLDLVESYKRPQDEKLFISFANVIKEMGAKSILVESQRTPLSYFQELAAKHEKVETIDEELDSIITFKKRPKLGPISFVEHKYRGADTKEKLTKILTNKSEAIFISALDNLAWLANCRGYHLPFQSTFLGRGFATLQKLYVFIEPSVPISHEANSAANIEFISMKLTEIPSKLKEICADLGIQKIKYDSGLLNTYDYRLVASAVGEENLINEAGTIYAVQSIKNDIEISELERSFEKSNQAIWETLTEAKERVDNGEQFSEVHFSDLCYANYKKQGANELSFNTIPGIAANSSIIHYGSPSSDMIAKLGDLMLLDSGGYYEGGFATDTTRTIAAGSSASDIDPKAKKFYTLVLKGVLQAQNAVFKDGTLGKEIDTYARAALLAEGLNFNHGTGHGVGINVHEPGVRISPTSELPMKAGQVVSIEPGYYVPNFGGIRIENVCYVVSRGDDLLGFQNMTWIGYEPLLIDFDLLEPKEKKWLFEHENLCKDKGRSFFTKEEFEIIASS